MEEISTAADFFLRDIPNVKISYDQIKLLVHTYR